MFWYVTRAAQKTGLSPSKKFSRGGPIEDLNYFYARLRAIIWVVWSTDVYRKRTTIIHFYPVKRLVKTYEQQYTW